MGDADPSRALALVARDEAPPIAAVSSAGYRTEPGADRRRERKRDGHLAHGAPHPRTSRDAGCGALPRWCRDRPPGNPPTWWKYYNPDQPLEEHSRKVIGIEDGAPHYVMQYREYPAGFAGRGHVHAHPWEHMAFIIEGSAILVCDGKEYPISAEDAVLVPPGAMHEWIIPGIEPMRRLVINPMYSRLCTGE